MNELSESRFPVVDALRGVALLGIVVVNVLLFTHPPSLAHLDATSFEGTADRLVAVVVKIFAEGKFIGLFSLLFGFGVATQVTRWRAAGDWRAKYWRRSAALGVIGFAHLVLVWFGDILTTYALLSVVLFFFVGRRPPVVLRWAVGILGVVTATALAALGALAVRAAVGAGIGADIERSMASSDVTEAERLAALYHDGAYTALVQERFANPGGLIFGIGFGLVVLALMLLGVWVAEAGVLTDVRTRRPLLQRLARVGIGVGLPLNVAVVAIQAFGGAFAVIAAQVLLMACAAPLLTVGVAASAVLVSDRCSFPWFEAAGRLALSNYLLQSVVFTTLLYPYGFGWYGRIGVAIGVGLATICFAGQLLLSRWWWRRVGPGPIERAWRLATYGRAVRRNPRKASNSA